MSYDEAQAISKVSEIDSKIRELRLKVGALNNDRNQLNSIMDLDDYEKNPDGSYVFGPDNEKIPEKVTPKDRGTGKTIDPARRDTIFTDMMAKSDIDLA